MNSGQWTRMVFLRAFLRHHHNYIAKWISVCSSDQQHFRVQDSYQNGCCRLPRKCIVQVAELRSLGKVFTLETF